MQEKEGATAVTSRPDARSGASRDELLTQVTQLKGEVAKIIIGQEQVIEEVLLAILSGGHALLVGVPGLAKTLMIQTIAQAMSLEFRRIQFTPDLVPSDITGTEVMEEDAATGQRIFRFVRGPIFANVILADEINRAPPRTQAAMLEAMQERHVSAAGETMHLPKPFFVLATQNPIEQEGTYPLPERSWTASSSTSGWAIRPSRRRWASCGPPRRSWTSPSSRSWTDPASWS